MIAKYLCGVGALVSLTIICMAVQVHPEQIERGGEWLSWSANERNRYVDGFISGYLKARLTVCNAADNLFEVGQAHRLGDDQHPTEVPSGRCLAAVDTYSRYKYVNSSIDFTAYTNVITEFYTKHPEYQGGWPMLSVFESVGLLILLSSFVSHPNLTQSWHSQ